MCVCACVCVCYSLKRRQMCTQCIATCKFSQIQYVTLLVSIVVTHTNH